MKKILLFFAGLIATSAFGQIEIRKYGESANVDGQTVTFNINLNDVPSDDEWAMYESAKLHVYNMSETDAALYIKRDQINVPADWKDNICWPPQCYQIAIGTATFSSPNTGGYVPTVLAGGSDAQVPDMPNLQVAEIKPQIYPGEPGSSATYKYSLFEVGNATAVASVTVVFNYVNNVSVNTVKQTELTMAPNPASDVVMINAEGIANATVKVIDVLGNSVYVGDFSNSKKLNVSDFKNGVYFVTVQGDAGKGFTKKLVIRH